MTWTILSRREAWCGALTSLAFVCVGTSARAQRTDSTETHIIVECRIGDVASTVLEARIRDGTLFLPARPVFALAGLDSSTVASARSLTGMSALLHAGIAFDTTALLVQIADSGVLPVSRRASRARARERLAASTAPTSVREAAPYLLPSAVSVAYAAQRDGMASVGTSFRVAGGIADLAMSRARATGLRVVPSWMSLPSPALGGARLRVGAIDELAGRSGVLLTNAPVTPADTFRLRELGLRLPPGTELELFDDGVLVGADSVRSDGLVRAQVAEHRGVHDMRMIVYDALGRTRVVRWAEYLPESLLRRGEFRYAIAAGACSRAACSRDVGQVIFAPADHLTAAARVGPSQDPRHPRGSTSSVSLDARLSTSAALALNGGSGGALAGELRVERPRGEALVLRAERTGTARSAPLPVLGALVPTSMSAADRIVSAAGWWRVGSSGSLAALAASAGANAIIGTSATAASSVGVLRGSVALVAGGVRCVSVAGSALVWGGWLPRAFAAARSAALDARAERRAPGCGDESSGALGLLLPALRWSAVDLGVSWKRARGVPSRVALSLTLRRRIGGVVDARAEVVGAPAAPLVRSGVSGALLFDALQRSVTFAGEAGDGAAGVHGVVYADGNANGRRDPGELAVAGALVRVGEVSAVSDARGIFVVAGLATDRVVRLTVDSVSVEDQGYVPDVPIAVTLVSRAMVRVDVPVRAAR